jgi:hypothetical protein
VSPTSNSQTCSWWTRRMSTLRVLAAGGVVLACGTTGQASAADLALAGRGGIVIPQAFVGLSLEYNSILELAGANPRRVNPVFVRLLRAIAPVGGGRLVLRIGGNSTDDAWWPKGRRTSALEKYKLTPTWTDVMAALLRKSGASTILGLNLAVDRRAVVREEARQLIARLPRGSVNALELGNEPEVYGAFPRFRDANGEPVYARAPGAWGYRRYRTDLRRFIRALRPVRGSIPLAAPASGSASWPPSLGKFLATTRADVGLTTYHAYPLLRCHVTPASRLWPSIPNLLAERSSHGLAARFARLVRISNRHHIPLRFDELGSVACGGFRGVSDTFASALWTVDTLFELAGTGADGVNLHMAKGLVYAPFQFSKRGSQWHAEVRPEAYGVLMFEQAAPAGATLLQIRTAPVPGLKLWATRDSARNLRVVAINKDATRARTVVLAIGTNRGPALVQRLQAPSLTTTVQSGRISLGGLSYGPDTTTGLLRGRPLATIVNRRHGVYAIPVGAASAAIVTIPR